MLFPAWIIEHIAQSAYWADRTIRSELADGLIASENDYTSNLTAAFRRQVNARAIPSLRASSYLLRPSLERALGADACIVLSNGKTFKLCLFEAKWPRLSTHENYWDSIQKSSGLSHFDEQIARQSRVASSVAVWETFYSEAAYGKQPAFMPSFVSSCVWHEEARAASLKRAVKSTTWSDLELAVLLASSGRQIDDMIRDVCECRKGAVFSGSNYLAAFENIGLPSQVLVIQAMPPQGEA